MPFCTKCGNEYKEGSTFCSSCGASLGKNTSTEFNTPIAGDPFSHSSNFQPYQPANQNNKHSNTPLIIIIIACVVVTVSTLCFALISLNSNGQSKSNTEAAYEDATSETIATVATEEPTTEDLSVEMISCEGRKYEKVKSELEELGLKVKAEYEFSEERAKDYVIRQSIDEGERLEKGDSVTLYVSKGTDECPYTYSQKAVVTASGSYGKLRLYDWKNGEWSKTFECDCTVGKNGISSNYGENIPATPKGIWKLGVIMTANRLSTNMSQYLVTSNTCIPYDTRSGYSTYYNQICEKQNLPSDIKIEPSGKLITNGSCNGIMLIEHNGDGFSSSGVTLGGGSSITICGMNSSPSPTGGCIDITASNFSSFISKLDADKNPYIEIK